MTQFRVTIEVGGPQGERWEPVTALVDTGATRTKVPRDVLARLGIVASDSRPARLADGRSILRDVGEARIRLQGKSYTNPITFGEAGEDSLLGSLTLETFSLAVDPINQRLIPVEDLELTASSK